MNTQWLYSIEQGFDGERNMLRDEAMAYACEIDGIPRLRLYTWTPWTLSLGHNQNDGGMDRERLREQGYGLVRRPTGGRAVLHAEELTYSVTMPSNGAGIHQTYARITGALSRGLELLGARDLEFSRSQPDFREHYENEESASCFSASALNELTWRGRKLLGSAQRRYGGVLLQHGSLLLGDAHLGIIDLLYPDADQARRTALRRRLAERTATLHDILDGAVPSTEAIAEEVKRGFADIFAAEMTPANDIATLPGSDRPLAYSQPNHTTA